MSHLTDFHKTINELDLDFKTHTIINKAALELANKSMKQGNDIALKIFRK